MSTLKVNTIRHTGASSDAVTLASDGTCTAKITNNLSNRNLIINGDMQVAQRGTQFTEQSGIAYHLDRWEINAYNLDTGRYQVDQVNDAPDGFKKSLKYSCTTANGSPNVNEQLYAQQQIEAQNVDWLKFYHASPDKVTLSFHVKANNTGTYGAALKLGDDNSTENSTDTRNYEFQYTISSANTWEKKTITITLDNDTNQTKSTGTSFGMAVQFWLSAGTNRDGVTSLLTWGGNGNATSGVANKTFFSSTNNNFFITGVQLEKGDTATDFEHRSYGDELARCQRYYQTLGGSPNKSLFTPATGNGTAVVTAFYKASVTFRAVPAYSYSALGDLEVYDFGASTSRGSPTGSALIGSISNKDWIYIDNNTSSTTAGAGHMFRANNTAQARFNLSAEL